MNKKKQPVNTHSQEPRSHKIAMRIVTVFLLIFAALYQYTISVDHRDADSFSSYYDIDFKTTVTNGQVTWATLAITDYHYQYVEFLPCIHMIADGVDYEINDVDVSCTEPSYSPAELSNFDRKTTYKYVNKMLAAFPEEDFDAIRNASEIKIRVWFDDGYMNELPLNAHDLQYWKDQMNRTK